MALDGINKINGLVSKLVGRTRKSDESGADFREYMGEAYRYTTRPRQEKHDSVDISRDASKLARYARELAQIRAGFMEDEGRGEFIRDGNPKYLEDTARAYNILLERTRARLKKQPAALNADTEILNVVLERVLTEEARELSQSTDINMFTDYITNGEKMVFERLIGANVKFLKSFFYLLNVMEAGRAEASAGELIRKTQSPSLERLSYSDIARMKEFGRHNKSLSLGAKWNMLSKDVPLSQVLRDHFAALYSQSYGVKNLNKAAAQSGPYPADDDFFFSGGRETSN